MEPDWPYGRATNNYGSIKWLVISFVFTSAFLEHRFSAFFRKFVSKKLLTTYLPDKFQANTIVIGDG